MNWVKRLIQRFGVYQVINVSAFLFDLVLIQLLDGIMPLYTAVIVAFLIAASLSYFANRFINFRDSRRSVWGGYGYFLSFALLRGGLIVLLTSLLLPYVHDYTLVARTIAGAVMGTVSFMLDYFITFKMRVATSEEPTAK